MLSLAGSNTGQYFKRRKFSTKHDHYKIKNIKKFYLVLRYNQFFKKPKSFQLFSKFILRLKI